MKELEKDMKLLESRNEANERIMNNFEKSTKLKDKEILSLTSKYIQSIKMRQMSVKTMNTDTKDPHLVIHQQKQTISNHEQSEHTLRNTIKNMHKQHEIIRKTLRLELDLLKKKDPQFIEKLYKERDDYKEELQRFKRQQKEKELGLVLNIHELKKENSKQNEFISNLDIKSSEELRVLIEQYHHQNVEYKDKILELSNIISNRAKKSMSKRLSLGMKKKTLSVDMRHKASSSDGHVAEEKVDHAAKCFVIFLDAFFCSA